MRLEIACQVVVRRDPPGAGMALDTRTEVAVVRATHD